MQLTKRDRAWQASKSHSHSKQHLSFHLKHAFKFQLIVTVAWENIVVSRLQQGKESLGFTVVEAHGTEGWS